MILYKIFPQSRLICVRIIGEHSTEETMDFIQRVRIDPLYSLEYDRLVNTSDRSTIPDIKELHKIKEAFDAQRHMVGRIKTAIVAPADAHFGMSRMLEMMAEISSPVQISVFRDLQSAIRWLGRSEEELGGFYDEPIPTLPPS